MFAPHRILFVALAVAMQPACGLPELPQIVWRDNDHIVDSGVRVQRMIDASDFDVVRVDGIASLMITCGEEYAVELDVDTNLEPLVTWEVRNGVLHIGTQKRNLETDEGIRFWISLPHLNALEVPGVASVDVQDINQAEIRLEVNGVADVVMQGQVQRVVVKHRGVGDLNLAGLVAEHARVRHHGIGEIDVHATVSLDAKAKGQGGIQYYGDPASMRVKEDRFGVVHPARRTQPRP